MSKILHSFGKPSSTSVTDDDNQSLVVQHREDGQSGTDNRTLMLHSRQESVDVVNTSGLFSGVNFNGAMSINVQINQK